MVPSSALYDADQRVRDTTVSQLAQTITIPHPKKLAAQTDN